MRTEDFNQEEIKKLVGEAVEHGKKQAKLIVAQLIIMVVSLFIIAGVFFTFVYATQGYIKYAGVLLLIPVFFVVRHISFCSDIICGCFIHNEVTKRGVDFYFKKVNKDE